MGDDNIFNVRESARTQKLDVTAHADGEAFALKFTDVFQSAFPHIADTSYPELALLRRQLNMRRQKLVDQYFEKVRQMRTIWNEAGGKALGDGKFAEYRAAEDEADSLAGQVSNIDQAPWGPRINAEMSRVERLEAREAFGHQSTTPGAGLDPAALTNRASGPFSSFGEQLQAVIRSSRPGAAPDARLYQVRAATGLSEGVGADGGFLVQTDMSAALLQRGMDTAKFAPRCTSFPISAGASSIDLPYIAETSRVTGSRWGGVRLYWAAKAGTLTASKPAFGKIHLEPEKLTGLVYLTDEVMADATVLGAFVQRAFTSEFAWTIDNEILRGTGAGTPLGILNAPCLVTVAKDGGQTANTITLSNIVKMWARFGGDEQNAIWLINRSVLPQLFQLALSVGNNSAPAFMPAGGLSASPYSTLFGRPVIPCEQCSTLGTVGDIVLADLSRYLLSTKGDLRIDSSLHVQFLYDELVMRFVYRINGQPEPRTAITPANGTDTLSPFVTLATRGA